jgi:hypothetical protein
LLSSILLHQLQFAERHAQVMARFQTRAKEPFFLREGPLVTTLAVIVISLAYITAVVTVAFRPYDAARGYAHSADAGRSKQHANRKAELALTSPSGGTRKPPRVVNEARTFCANLVLLILAQTCNFRHFLAGSG